MFERNSLCLQSLSFNSHVEPNPIEISDAASKLIDAKLLEDISSCMSEVAKTITIISAMPGRESNADIVENARLAIDHEIYLKLRDFPGRINPTMLLLIFARSIKQYRAGNCYEFSLYGHFLLQKMKIDSQVFRIINGNHVFVVVNLDKNSDVKDYPTWNKDAIVVDLLFNRIYLPEEIPLLMKSMVYNEESYTVDYQAYNPKLQHFNNNVIEEFVNDWRTELSSNEKLKVTPTKIPQRAEPPRKAF